MRSGPRQLLPLLCSPVTDYVVGKIKEQQESLTDCWDGKVVFQTKNRSVTPTATDCMERPQQFPETTPNGFFLVYQKVPPRTNWLGVSNNSQAGGKALLERSLASIDFGFSYCQQPNAKCVAGLHQHKTPSSKTKPPFAERWKNLTATTPVSESTPTPGAPPKN